MIEQYNKARVSILKGDNVLYGNRYCKFTDILPGHFIILSGESSLYFIDKIENKSIGGKFIFRTVNNAHGKTHEVELEGEFAYSLEENEEIQFNWGEKSEVKTINRILKNNGKLYAQIFQPFKNDNDIVEFGSGTWEVMRKAAFLTEHYPNSSKVNIDYIYGSSITKNLKIPLIEYNNPKYKSIFWFAMQKLDSLADQLSSNSQMIESVEELMLPELYSETFRKESVSDGSFIIKPKNPYNYAIKKIYIVCDKGSGIISLFNKEERFDILSVDKDGYSKDFDVPIVFQKDDRFKISVKNIEQIEGLSVYFEFFNCN